MRFWAVRTYKISSHRSAGTERTINLLMAGQWSPPLETGPAVGHRDNDHGPATLVEPPPTESGTVAVVPGKDRREIFPREPGN
jgi:hypothetical protein